MTPFADRLRARAKALDLSHAEVARRAGIAERRYANYVLGRTEPDLSTLAAISKALGVTPNDLLGLGEDEAQTPSRVQKLQIAAETLPDHELDLLLLQVRAWSKPRT